MVKNTPAGEPAEGVPVTECSVDVDSYKRIVERVYSRVATEIYRQIETDVQEKIDLFPTSYLRAVALYREAQDWTGVIFGVYNLVSAIYALFLPAIANKIGRKKTHALSLFIGGIGLISFFFAPNKEFLVFSMACVGVAWGSILSMPYVILSSSIPAGKMGIYMGIFNFFITIPQIINGVVGGPMVKNVYNNQPVYAIVLAGIFMLCAAVSVVYVYDPASIVLTEEKPK